MPCRSSRLPLTSPTADAKFSVSHSLVCEPLIPSSSGVEQPAVNRRVGGSNPSSGAPLAVRDSMHRATCMCEKGRPARRPLSSRPGCRSAGWSGARTQRTDRPAETLACAVAVAVEPFDGAPFDIPTSACVAPGVGGISVGNAPMHAAANKGSTTKAAVRRVRGRRMSTLRDGSWSAARLAWRLSRRSLVALRRRLSPGLPVSRRPSSRAIMPCGTTPGCCIRVTSGRVAAFRSPVRVASRRPSLPKICLRSFLPERRSLLDRPMMTSRARARGTSGHAIQA